MAECVSRVAGAVGGWLPNWEEDECWWYYNMHSLHRLFEVVGSQLTESDVRVLSFLLEETQPAALHPLHPARWSVDVLEEETAAAGSEEPGARALADWWERRQRRVRKEREASKQEGASCEGSFTSRNGVELLLELERRGLCDETNFRYLMQLLRILTRHDLLPCVSMKRPRTVSPERYSYGSLSFDSEKQMDDCLNSASAGSEQDQWRTGVTPNKRKRATRKGSRRSINRRGDKKVVLLQQEQPVQNKVTCGNAF